MGTQHLILGKTTDFITGSTVTDTHDERARQKIAQFLVREKGYEKTEISPRVTLPLELEGKTGNVQIDFVLKPGNKTFMLVLFRPGSLVSRRRTAIAAARLLEDHVIPYSAVTNAEDAEIMETVSGKVISTGLEAVFARAQAVEMLEDIEFSRLSEERREKEKRILFAMEVLTQKECDDYTCKNI
ncbi:MAG: type I restriction enzyme HsdR N-terminal domain-containing protein [Desulfobacterales bacterium]|nr:type I restriction enzyme HsdR N-terminal domain-containing protein [Desulfobacterales bacterium]